MEMARSSGGLLLRLLRSDQCGLHQVGQLFLVTEVRPSEYLTQYFTSYSVF